MKTAELIKEVARLKEAAPTDVCLLFGNTRSLLLVRDLFRETYREYIADSNKRFVAFTNGARFFFVTLNSKDILDKYYAAVFLHDSVTEAMRTSDRSTRVELLTALKFLQNRVENYLFSERSLK